MGLKLRRRSVYIGTIVTLVAMVGGLALAVGISGITFAPGTGNQNFGQISSGNTLYGAGPVVATLNLVSGDGSASGTCGGTAAYSASAATIVVAGAASACTATGEWYDLLTFTGVSVTATTSDTFWVAVNGGLSGTSFTVTSGTIFNPATLTIYIDDGPTSAAPQITSLTVTVNGS